VIEIRQKCVLLVRRGHSVVRVRECFDRSAVERRDDDWGGDDRPQRHVEERVRDPPSGIASRAVVSCAAFDSNSDGLTGGRPPDSAAFRPRPPRLARRALEAGAFCRGTSSPRRRWPRPRPRSRGDRGRRSRSPSPSHATSGEVDGTAFPEGSASFCASPGGSRR
jgi:hypothetical protein